jgi:hypothetical protein
MGQLISPSNSWPFPSQLLSHGVWEYKGRWGDGGGGGGTQVHSGPCAVLCWLAAWVTNLKCSRLAQLVSHFVGPGSLTLDSMPVNSYFESPSSGVPPSALLWGHLAPVVRDVKADPLSHSSAACQVPPESQELWPPLHHKGTKPSHFLTHPHFPQGPRGEIFFLYTRQILDRYILEIPKVQKCQVLPLLWWNS